MYKYKIPKILAVILDISRYASLYFKVNNSAKMVLILIKFGILTLNIVFYNFGSLQGIEICKMLELIEK